MIVGGSVGQSLCVY